MISRAGERRLSYSAPAEDEIERLGSDPVVQTRIDIVLMVRKDAAYEQFIRGACV